MTEVHPTIAELIGAMSQPTAYSFPVDSVDVRQTHISIVFLVGKFVYKVKKSVRLPFLDFSTLERRHFFCEEEVRLNRRLAPDVYLGVVPICASPAGVVVEGTGPVLEWAVKMIRLPDEAMFASRMDHDRLTDAQVENLARRIAQFHDSMRVSAADQSRSTREIAQYGRFEQMAAAVRGNIEFARTQIGQTISEPVYERLQNSTERALEQLRTSINRRADEGLVREVHGDLHLDHIYLFEDRPSPGDLVIVDCIEFNEAFRCVDVVADSAFCVMDFKFRGRRDFAQRFCRSYFATTGDDEGRLLLPFYTAYRAAVRGKVDGILAGEPEVASAERASAAARSTAYWLLALGELEPVEQRPALVLVSGLPGTGKSTLARALSEKAGFEWIRSDAVRKELAGVTPENSSAPSEYQSGIYTTEWTERTYAECLRRATVALRLGRRVLVDATFASDRHRREFLEAAIGLGVSAAWLVCDAAPGLVHDRLLARTRDVSDADWTIYQKTAAAWQPPSRMSQRSLATIDANKSPQDSLEQALVALSSIMH